MYRRFFEGVCPESIYFGGGTSNLYSWSQIVELMNIVRSVFPVLSGITEVTLEGHSANIYAGKAGHDEESRGEPHQRRCPAI